MKKIILVAILMFAVSAVSFEQLEETQWGPWHESNIKGIDYRTGYEYYNETSARQGKPAHLWSVEIRNRFSVGKSLWCCLGDQGQSKDDIKDKRFAPCIESGSTKGFYKYFTNTPPSGTINIYIWDVKNCN